MAIGFLILLVAAFVFLRTVKGGLVDYVLDRNKFAERFAS